MKRFRFLEVAMVLLLAGGGIWMLATRPLDDRLHALLPQEPELLQSLSILEDSKLSGQVIIHVQADDSGFPHEGFVEAMDQLVADLSSPLITQVTTPVSTLPTPEDIRELSVFAPQMLGAETYEWLEQRLSSEGIQETLSAIRRTMMSPHSIPLGNWFRRDPFGARASALQPLEVLGRSSGFRVSIKNDHFFSEDGQSAMVIIETPVPATDHANSVRLMEHIQACLARLPDGLHGSVVAAHRHTLSNQHLIRRDIAWVSTLATLFFSVLFLVHYRDARSAAIFAVPLVGLLMALAVTGMAGARIVAVVMGMCSVLVGIAIDYAIHVYVALTHPETDRTRDEAVRSIHRSLWLSALTTLIPILTLILSSIPGYRQLGILAGASILFSLLLAVRIMPLLFPRDLKAAPLRSPLADATRQDPPVLPVLTLFLLALIGSIIVAAGIRVDLDFARLSGTEEDVLRDEKAFFIRFGSGPSSMGIVVVWDEDPEIARQANDLLYRQISAMEGMSNTLVSIAPILPSLETRRANAARWVEFWDQHEEPARVALDRVGLDSGFAPQAFDPFFDALHEGTDPEIFPFDNRLMRLLEDQFVQVTDDRVSLLTFYQDDPVMQQALASIRELPAAHAVISHSRLQSAFASFVLRDLRRQAVVALILVVIFVALFVRQARGMLLIALPPVAGAVGMLAGLRIAGEPLTPVTLLAGFLVAGNCFDYGVFMLHAWRSGERAEISRGVYLAWLTTAGASSLLLVARHPVLYATGLALFLGVTCGYLTARWALWSAASVLRIPVEAPRRKA
jgi:uncharacterized protein